MYNIFSNILCMSVTIVIRNFHNVMFGTLLNLQLLSKVGEKIQNTEGY